MLVRGFDLQVFGQRHYHRFLPGLSTSSRNYGCPISLAWWLLSRF